MNSVGDEMKLKVKNFTDKETMSAVQKGFYGYEKVVDREIHYVYLNKSGRYNELVMKPHSTNFMHLCGVYYLDSRNKKLSAEKFYEGLTNKKLSYQGIKHKDGYTNLKLAVLPELHSLTSCNDLRIVDTPTTYEQNSFTHAIKTRRKIFVLGLEEEINPHPHFVPKSLLNTKSLPHIDSGHQVHCIYILDVSTRNRTVICKDSDFTEYEKKKSYIYAK